MQKIADVCSWLYLSIVRSFTFTQSVLQQFFSHGGFSLLLSVWADYENHLSECQGFFFFFFFRHLVKRMIYEITRLTKIIFTLKKIIPVVENFQQPTSLPTGASVLDFKFNLRLITWIQEYLGNLKSHNLYIRPAMTNSQMKLTVCCPLLLNAKGSNLLK